MLSAIRIFALLALVLPALGIPSAPSGPAGIAPLGAGAASTNLLAELDATPLAEVQWEANFLVATRRAASESRPVLLYATMPDCAPCRMLESTTLTHPSVRQRLRELVCLKIDITQDRHTAQALGIEATPTLIVLSSDGEVRGRFTGFMYPPDFLNALSTAASGQGSESEAARQRIQEVLGFLKKKSVPPDRWPDVLQALASERHRQAVVSGILALEPSPRTNLVAQLSHAQLAVRLGALELLEQLAGDDYGFDPWEDAAQPGEPPVPALARWQAWAVTNAAAQGTLYTPLTREQIAGRLQDLLSDDADRVRRARRNLTLAGPAVAGLAAEFLAARPGLAPGLADRVREVRYASLMTTRSGFDAADHARRLVFGNLDTQLQALRDIRSQKAAAATIAREYLGHANPLLRETAVETLLATARKDALPPLRELVSHEPNREVIIAVARGLRAVRSRPSADLLAELLERDDEDVVIAALGSLSKIGALAPNEAICKRLADSRWRVRVAALQTVSELGIRDAAAAVEKLIEDEDSFVRYTAILTLAKIGDKARAVKWLEKAFLESDENKPPVIAAFGALTANLPASFVNASTGKPPEVLLPMLDALGRCGKRGVPMATAFANHADADVACAALSILARHGAKSANADLIEALRRGGRGPVLAVLESIKREDEESRSYSSSPDGDMSDLLAELDGARAASTASPAGPAGDPAVSELFDAFLGGAPAPAAATPAAPPVAIGDLFDAFGTTQAIAETTNAASAPAPAPEATPEPGLLDAVRACRDRFPDDGAVQGAALLAQLRLGDVTAIPALAGILDRLPADQKVDAAVTLKKKTTPEALSILTRLLRDPEAGTRTAAAATLSAQCHLPAWCDALFDELSRTNTPLRLHEAVDQVLQRQNRLTAERDNLRRRAEALLAKPATPALTLLAVALYGTAGSRLDAAKLAPLRASDDPRLRRETYWSLLAIDPASAATLITQAAEDASEDVRAVVPAALSRGARSWTHRFSDTESVSSWTYPMETRSLKEPERAALRRLAADPVPELRAESMIAQMSLGESFDAANLMAAINECEDVAGMSSRAADVLDSSYTKLNSSYAPLLPLLDVSRTSDDTRQRIVARLQGTAGVAAVPSLTATNAPLVRTSVSGDPTPPPLAPPPAATNELRMVFFHEPGCEECEQARALLASLKESFAELRVEELDIREPANRKFNATLCDKFQVPERYRARTPTLVAGAGYLVGSEITFERLADLLVRSLDKPLTDKKQ